MSDHDTPTDPRPLADLIAATREQVEQVSAGDESVHEVVPGYQVRHEIHRGGQGVVYLAHHAATRRDVAIKIMRQGPFAGKGERARFEREVQLLASIKHPNIVAIHDSGTASGSDYFVMDYIEGAEFDVWADRLRSGQEDTNQGTSSSTRAPARERIVEAFIKMCDVVAVAHQRGVIHRDIKPSNIRVDETGEPFVLDFGLAKATISDDTDDGSRQLTMTGQFLGTLRWASPEQLSGSSTEADTRSDVYALGLVLYRALAGRMPYDADTALTDMVHVITEVEPERLSTSSPGTEADLETIVLKCLSKSAERRYPSAAELAADLRRFVRREPIRARPESSWYTLRMFAARNKAAVAGAAAFVSLLIASSIALGVLYAKANRSARLANQRAEETKRTAEFQVAQLSSIDAEEMGLQLREMLLQQIKQTSSLGDEQAKELEGMLSPTNFTNVALDLIDASIFSGTLTAIDEQFDNQPLMRAKLLESAADTMWKLGLVNQAEQPAREALRIRREQQGEGHTDTLFTQTLLGTIVNARGATAEAASMLLEAVEGLRKTLGDEHRNTLKAIEGLGDVVFAQGQYAKALSLYEEAVAGLSASLGDNHEVTLLARTHIGKALQKLERLEEAQVSYEQLRATQSENFGQHDARTMATRSNLATILYQRGKFAEAIREFQEVLADTRKALGDKHIQTLVVEGNLARAMIAAGNLAEAIPRLEGALKRRLDLFGPLHEGTLNTMSMLANAYSRVGRSEEALKLQGEVVEGYRSTVGTGHPHTGRALNGYGIALESAGKLEEAERIFREAIEINRATFGDDHSETLLSIGNLGALLSQQDRTEEAEPLLDVAVAGYSAALGVAHPHTNTFMRRLAYVLRTNGKLADSLGLSIEALGVSEQIHGEHHPVTQNARLLVGGTLKEMGRLEDALPYYEDGVAGYVAAFGTSHRYALLALRQKGQLLDEMRRSADAAACYEEALAGQRKVLGEFSTEAMITAAKLGAAFLELDRAEEAEALLLEVAGVLEGEDAHAETFAKAVGDLAALYDSWHEVDNEAGFDTKASAWREKLGDYPATKLPRAPK